MLHSNTDIIKHPVTTLAFFHFLSDIYGVGMEIYLGGRARASRDFRISLKLGKLL